LLIKTAENVYCFQDTCNVYVIQEETEAILVDFGSGDVLEHLPSVGIQHIKAILITHHHRDQVQGLAKANTLGIPIWVPHMEQDLIRNIDEHWQARDIYNNYNVRQDRFSLLASVSIAGTLHDYARYSFGATEVTVFPTPGHTLGSITFMIYKGNKKLAFTGDLIYAPGKVWSMSAIQWTYNGAEGAYASILSLLALQERKPDLLLPSHGKPIHDSDAAINLLVERFSKLLGLLKLDGQLFQWRKQPFEAITPHLLMNKTSIAYSYVLLSESGKALIIDYGYDFKIGCYNAGFDRSARRPWLYNIELLKREYGVQSIDVVLPTHCHDDHVAGINLLREIEGAEVWAAENFADLLENPARFNVPCIWFDPIPVSRRIPLGQPFKWEEYEFTLYEQGGHTLYAVAISFTVDKKRVIAIGDQYLDDQIGNYTYQNLYQIGDYVASAELYSKIHPDLIITGHFQPWWVDAKMLDSFAVKGEMIDRFHQELLPLETINLGAEGFCATIYPYQQDVQAGENVMLEVEIMNPAPQEETIELQWIVPEGWETEEQIVQLKLFPGAKKTLPLTLHIPKGIAQRRARVAVDITVGTQRLGQQAEALITITRGN